MSLCASAIGVALTDILKGVSGVEASAATYNNPLILTTTGSTITFIVTPSSGENELSSFGGEAVDYTSTVRMDATAFVRLTGGDLVTYFTNQWKIIGATHDTIDANRTLNNTVEVAFIRRWNRDGTEWDIGGTVWKPIHFEIECLVIN